MTSTDAPGTGPGPVAPGRPGAVRGELDLDMLRTLDHTGLLDGVDRAVVWDVPLTTRFRGLTRRDGVLVHGPAGWGEVAPFWDHGAEAAAMWLAAGLESAVAGVNTPLLREAVPVNVTVPEVGPERARALVAISGCTTAKVKVGGRPTSLRQDLMRLEAVRDGLGPEGKVRIDVNGAWDLDAARRNLPLMDRAAVGLEYAEQPCAAVEDLAALRRELDVPIAADESIRLSTDPLAVARLEAADVAVLKVAPLGGVAAALTLAERLGLPAVVSSALDTSVGIYAGVRLAAALPELGHACGLGTVRLLGRDVAVPSLAPATGILSTRPVHVSVTLLRAAAADDELTARWQVRLAHLLGALATRRAREASRE